MVISDELHTGSCHLWKLGNSGNFVREIWGGAKICECSWQPYMFICVSLGKVIQQTAYAFQRVLAITVNYLIFFRKQCIWPGRYSLASTVTVTHAFWVQFFFEKNASHRSAKLWENFVVENLYEPCWRLLRYGLSHCLRVCVRVKKPFRYWLAENT